VSGCGYAAKTERLLLRHKSKHRLVVGQSSVEDTGLVGRYRCGRCSYETTQREHFRRHVEAVHDNVRPWLCHICGRTFKRHDGLLHHSLVHDNTVDTQRLFSHTCTICQRSFRSKVPYLICMGGARNLKLGGQQRGARAKTKGGGSCPLWRRARLSYC